jgi:hypothetical protein
MLASTHRYRTTILGLYAGLTVSLAAFFAYLISRFGVFAYGASTMFVGVILPLLLFSFRFDRAVAEGSARVLLDAPWRKALVDLRNGFKLTELRIHPKALVLEVDNQKYQLVGFGTLDEVDAWLKAAQVAV